VCGGIAHAFNGSAQQAGAFVERGWRLGFGGAMTFERARQIRQLASSVPDSVPVLETDAPDIPPHWLYRNAEQRALGERARNEPAELPRIAHTLAQLRGWTLPHTAAQTRANACAARPRLCARSLQRRRCAGWRPWYRPPRGCWSWAAFRARHLWRRSSTTRTRAT